MALKVPYDSTLEFLTSIRTGLLMSCELRLYSNNHTPADGDDVSDYTECTFPGYSEIALNGWSAPALNIDNKAEVTETKKTFTAGTIVTPENVYGIYVTDAGGDLVYAEKNPAGVVSMAVAGQEFSYTPKFTVASEF